MSELIEVRDLTKSFGDNHVLRGIDFGAGAGTVTALLGPSGSGKTTVLRSLNALEVPDSGYVRINDASVDFAELPSKGAQRKERLHRLRSQTGMVFQSHHLFPHLSVLQNIIEGPVYAHGVSEDEAVARARDLLEKVGLADREDARPAQLSGGQQQRVGIARALALQPEAVLLDEPTSALDPELVGEVLGVIKDLCLSGQTMLIVTHEVRFAEQVADQVLFLDQGVIAEHGGPEVISDPQQPRTRQFLARLLAPQT